MSKKSFFSSMIVVGILIGCFYFLSKNTRDQNVSFTPQKIQIFTINQVRKGDDPLNVKATTLPQFAFSLINEKFKNLWQAEAKERESLVDINVSNAKGDTALEVQTKFDDTKKQLIVTPKTTNKVKPGLYTISIKTKTYTGKNEIITQDFTWGVLAINTNKGIYQVGEQVKIGMAVLGDLGNTKCKAVGKITFGTAKVWLIITTPSGKIERFSTDDNSISGSNDCSDRSVTNNPDFFAVTTAKELGKYKIRMQAENLFGQRYIDSSFLVQQNSPEFVIERTKYPTRIFPRVDYPVTVSIKANKNYSGPIYETIPDNFKIFDVSQSGKVTKNQNFQIISWYVHWKKGETYALSYTIHFPPIAPEFYLIGPLQIGDFDEGREWKIASDSIFQLVQEAHNTGSGTSVSVDLPNTPTKNNLLLKICYRTNSSSFNGQSGWSTAYNNSSGPRIYMYYRVAPTSMSTTITCSTTSSGTLGVQALEFSGNSTSSVRDQRSRRNNVSCTSGSFASASLTPSNPDVLIISAFSSTTARTVNSHTNSFVDNATSFNGTSGTFDSGWLEAINNPPVSTTDTVSYSGNAGTCDNVIVSFNPTISISQGSYRFFENADSTIPGDPLETINTPFQLHEKNMPFRLRVLLDIDSPSGTTLGIDSGDWQLEYAQLPASGDCADGDYNPVDTIANGTPIAYNPNSSSGGNNAFISSSGNDPTDSGYTTQLEDYMETWLDDNSEDITNHQNTLGNNQAGLFDFSLIDNTNDAPSTTYCLIITNGDGSFLDAYKNYPKITTPYTEVFINGGTTITGGTTIQ